jgi:hypothetical protein
MTKMLASSGGGSAAGAVAGLVIIAILIALYFIPLIVAVLRKVPNVGSVGVVNFFLGWTFIGWVVALAMACRSADRNVVVNQYAAAAQAPPPPPSPAGWFPDPEGKHQLRYFDGAQWTQHVSTGGVAAID